MGVYISSRFRDPWDDNPLLLQEKTREWRAGAGTALA